MTSPREQRPALFGERSCLEHDCYVAVKFPTNVKKKTYRATAKYASFFALLFSRVIIAWLMLNVRWNPLGAEMHSSSAASRSRYVHGRTGTTKPGSHLCSLFQVGSGDLRGEHDTRRQAAGGGRHEADRTVQSGDTGGRKNYQKQNPSGLTHTRPPFDTSFYKKIRKFKEALRQKKKKTPKNNNKRLIQKKLIKKPNKKPQKTGKSPFWELTNDHARDSYIDRADC